jgi:hypothetical protein
MSGPMEWRINKEVAMVPINHFELSADANGIVWQNFEPGLAGATATVRGHINVDATDSTEGGTPAFKLGTTVTLDLLFTRGPWGYIDLSAKLQAFEAGTNIENQTGTFTATFRLNSTVGVAAAS